MVYLINKIHILFVVPNLLAGGSQRVMVNLVNALDRKHFIPKLTVVRSDDSPFWTDIKQDVAVINLGKKRVRHGLIALLRLIRKESPDIVFSTLGYLNLSLIVLKPFFPKGTKLIVREANTPSAYLKSVEYPRIFSFFYKKLYPHADKIVCQSDSMKNDLINNFYVPDQKIKHIYNPINVNKIKSLAAINGNPLKINKINIISAGSLTYQKGFDILIKAFQLVHKKRPNFELTIIGEGKEKKNLKKLTEVLKIDKYTKFVGFQSNPFVWFKHADLFVSSSRWEGLPNVVLEALACGTPVIATKCSGGTIEIIKEEINGWLVNPNDPTSLAEKILNAYENIGRLSETMICNSINKFYESTILKQYEELFKGIII